MFKFVFLLILLPLYLLSETKTLIFAPLATKDIEDINTQFLPMIKYLEKKLNVKIQMDYNNDYDTLLEKFMNGKIDIAYLGPLPYLTLEEEYPDTMPLVNFKNEKGEVSYTCSFVSFISNEESIENMTDTKIALTQPLSTCGYLFVNDVLNHSNTNIEKNKYKYLGKHDSVALSVIRGEFKYGGLKTDIAQGYAHLGLKEIMKSKDIPSFILVGNSKTLDNNMLINIKNSMLFVEKKELSTWHESMKFGTKEINSADYDYIRKLIKSTKISHESNF
ncbi:PhnD/SsuA/transferrin family substrate-binding protein [Arcobacter sp. s6]|uniref:PhnD/SsuA/transferrin family substrate-binding protein n=1 Tax=Arcobacter sp. s6 TaxID=3230363 RepID=UPI0034A01909